MRVLFITRKWPPAVGGMETYSRGLTKEIANLVELEVCALPGRSNGRPPGILAFIRFFVSTAFRLWRHRREYDLVHFGDFVLFPLAWLHASWVPGVTRVVTVHGLDLIYGNRSGMMPVIYRHYVSWAAKRHQVINHYIANSSNTACLSRELGFVPVTPVPLGIEIPTDEAVAAPSLANERYVLFVGRLVRRKGAVWFAENVLPRLPEDLFFHVVGEAREQKEEAVLRGYSRVRLLGRLPDEELARERAGALAMVMPNIPNEDCTDVEGFGLVALEAPRNGIPLLAADIEGISDAVKDGTTGFLLPASDAAAWAGKLGEVLAWTGEQRTQFARSAFMALKKHYSWQRVARDTLTIYKKQLEFEAGTQVHDVKH